MMMMTTAPVGLIVLLLTIHSFNTISATTCRSPRGRTTQCEEDQTCCRANGRTTGSCCSRISLPWWAWLAIGLGSFGVAALLVGIPVCCAIYLYKRKRHAEIVQPVRRFEPPTGSGTIHFTRVETSLNNTETNTSTDAPPKYSDVSQSSEQLPPPYPRIL